jgi:hypothetical protein|tara:strand:- start:5624 stop:6088 length:465 start_codon:yes stop_codon:yes gene_type:complete
MKKLLLIFVLFLLPSIANPIDARSDVPKLKLIAVVVDWCPYCHKWQEEVLPAFNHWIEAEVVNVTSGRNLPRWYKNAYDNGTIERLYGIPAFIIWDIEAERELVRWVGYGGKDHFYEILDKAINKALEKQVQCGHITSALERRSAGICKAENIS